MQPYIPDPGNKRPKFLIQAAIITDETIELTEFWKMLRPEDIWGIKIKCKVVSNKYRQDGGGDTVFPGYQQEDEETFESMAKLVKQVCVLEEEVHTLREQTKIFVNMAICVATVIAVILGANLLWWIIINQPQNKPVTLLHKLINNKGQLRQARLYATSQIHFP